MDRTEEAYLIFESWTQDGQKVQRPTQTRHRVFVNRNDLTRAEFFEAGRAGLDPEMRLDIFGPDYNGEQLIEYKGTVYSIYRTHARTTDVLELYVEKRQGNGQA